MKKSKGKTIRQWGGLAILAGVLVIGYDVVSYMGRVKNLKTAIRSGGIESYDKVARKLGYSGETLGHENSKLYMELKANFGNYVTRTVNIKVYENGDLKVQGRTKISELEKN